MSITFKLSSDLFMTVALLFLLAHGFVDLSGGIDHVNHVQAVQRPLHDGGVVGAGPGGVRAVSQGVSEGVEDGVEKVELDLSQGGEDSTEEGDLGTEEGSEERGNQLGDDDGSEDGDEERDELGQLAQVEVQTGIGGSSVALIPRGRGLIGRGGVLLLV